ncbi:hypothetical protein FPV67DRAFT_1417403, partial [Lyophyllum atratum]
RPTMAATRKSAKATPVPVPEPAPSSTGRSRKLTEKQKEKVADETSRAEAAKKRAFVASLRAEQAQEEHRGFTRLTVSNTDQNDAGMYLSTSFFLISYQIPIIIGPQFSSVTIPPPIKITTRNGRTLVHRVSGKENEAPLPDQQQYQPTPGRQLVRRLPGASRPDPPVMEPRAVSAPFINLRNPSSHPASSMPRNETPRRRPGPYTPRVEGYYQQPDGVEASDFDEFTKNILEDAIVSYRAHIRTINPYPSRDEDRGWAGAVWVAACQDRGVQVEFDEDVLKLITARSSQTRGQVKTLCRPLVESLYGLAGENGKRANRNKDPAKRTGMYLHPIIQAVVNKMWFKSKTDEGVTHEEYSTDDAIPLVTIAFVLTAVECCLDEWQSGEHQDVPFSVTGYQDKFDVHLQTLKSFETNTKDANIVPRLLKHILKNARKHAKVDTVAASRAIQLGDVDFEAAKKEWTDLVLSDDEN